MTLDEVEQQLGGRPFYRCHQSYIVNTNHIGKLGANDVIMKNGHAVPMRKNGRDGIRNDMASLLSSRMFEVQRYEQRV
jgi:DNA-binding LytR/AlgR family response regulator